MPDVSVEYNTRSIYHLLRRTFGQCVTIAEVIDFDVFDVVAIIHVHLPIYMRGAIVCSSISSWRRGSSSGRFERCLDRRNIDMLDAFLGLDLSVDSCSGSSYRQVSKVLQRKLQEHQPAAAAGSAPAFFALAAVGLSGFRSMGLLLRLDSDFLAGGERDRLSNRDALFGSGSFWSKRDRFAVRLSVSSISVECIGFHVCAENKCGANMAI
jgi:hypothetical protein